MSVKSFEVWLVCWPVVPKNYLCQACGKQGAHWIMVCPIFHQNKLYKAKQNISNNSMDDISLLWTKEQLIKTIINECNISKQKQLNIALRQSSGSVQFAQKWYNLYNESTMTRSGYKLIGDVIFELSKLNKFDRIINVAKTNHNVGYGYYYDEQGPILYWMIPLLSKDFKSLISFEGFDCPHCDNKGLKYKDDYNILCEMISRDKMISVHIGFYVLNEKWDAENKAHLKNIPQGNEIWDDENNKFKIDTTKLINGIKSTNTLKEINLISRSTQHDSDYILECMLKEALLINFSVITLICKGNYGTITDMKSFYNGNQRDEASINHELHSKYHSWWIKIQKRNEESQLFNKTLFDEKDDDNKDSTIWNNNKCAQDIAYKILETHFNSINKSIFDKKGDKCFCRICHGLRDYNKSINKSGQPLMTYSIPINWTRFGLKIDDIKCKENDIWKKWHVAFHGTTKNAAEKILKSNLKLLKPGDVSNDGQKIEIQQNHIAKSFERFNKYSNKFELFNPLQIYMSPSIKYAGHQVYAKSFYCSHPENINKTLKVQFVFQLRIRPNAYDIGQETVGAAINGLLLDKYFNNNELEWYTQNTHDIIIYGLLLKITQINVP